MNSKFSQSIFVFSTLFLFTFCTKEEHIPTVEINKNTNFNKTNPLLFFEVLSNNELITISKNGDLFLSGDDGESWDQLPSAPFEGTTISEIQFTTVDSGFVLAEETLYITADKGKTWEISKTKCGSMTFYSSTIGYVLDENGTYVYRTTNGGTSWQSMNSWPNLVIEDADNIYILGEQKLITTANLGGYTNYSNDGGKTWHTDSTAGTQRYSNLHFVDNQIYVTNEYGKIYRSSDLFKTASQTQWDENSDFPLHGLDIKNGIGIAVGNSQILISEDNGNSWTSKLTQEGNTFVGQLTDVKIISFSKAIACSYNGEIYFINL